MVLNKSLQVRLTCLLGSHFLVPISVASPSDFGVPCLPSLPPLSQPLIACSIAYVSEAATTRMNDGLTDRMAGDKHPKHERRARSADVQELPK